MVTKVTELASPHAPNILNTLGMMDTGSDFIEALAKNDAPSTEYYVVAGDLSNYQVDQEQSVMGRFMEKMEVAMGKLIYFDKPSDIAVSVEDIKKVPFLKSENVKEVSCHHLNYFFNEESVEKWKEWI